MQWYDMYPNPAEEQITLAGYIPNAGPLDIKITDMNGRTIYMVNKNSTMGHFQYSIPVDGLTSGSYIIQISDGRTARSKTMIKK
jgi:hypothetical protein